ncbi:DNA/RNA non-specific endonuclease [Aeromonas rivuli]|uniref:DNA/RNA non-specific endonuclease n=1 Tax=Aeromonas rivuli TaxID=648794 RepID=UPI00069491E0|nr:DNA/RNA non-specific endonuclease [Aeromonas rivuli]
MGKSVSGVIGDKADALGEAGKTIAHGVTSGAIVEITGGKFAAGAAGGAISEWSSGWVSQTFTNPNAQAGLSQILGGLAAVAVTGDQNDFNTGADRAETVHRYNYLSHQQKEIREQDFASCQGELLCVAQHGAKWDAISALQETSYGAGLLAGVPAGMLDSVQGLVQLGLNPAQTLEALKSLITSSDLLGNVTDAIKQNYLARVEAAEAQYQQAGASGSFNAGVEYGKLLAEGASLVAGGVGVVKGGALLTEKITAKLVKEGVGKAVTAGPKAIPESSYPSLAKPSPNAPSNVILGELDSLGRPTGVTAVLREDSLGGGSSANPAIRPPGFEGQPANHARGHLLANSLGGAGDDARNLVTLFQRNANHPNMSSFERQVRGAVQSGETVSYRAVPIYTGTNPMPTGVTLSARWSGGFTLDVSIPNVSGVK